MPVLYVRDQLSLAGRDYLGCVHLIFNWKLEGKFYQLKFGPDFGAKFGLRQLHSI